MNDPIVEEVHAARREIFAECGEDFKRYIERLREDDLRRRTQSPVAAAVGNRNGGETQDMAHRNGPSTLRPT